MPVPKNRLPIYPRPVSPVCAEPIPLYRNEIPYESSSSEEDCAADAKARKRQRIEAWAERYLRGGTVAIMSAGLRGPFEDKNWKNPWIKGRRKRTKENTTPLHEVPETRRPQQFKPVEIPETTGRPPQRFKPAVEGARRIEAWLKTNKGYLQEAGDDTTYSPTPTANQLHEQGTKNKISNVELEASKGLIETSFSGQPTEHRAVDPPHLQSYLRLKTNANKSMRESSSQHEEERADGSGLHRIRHTSDSAWAERAISQPRKRQSGRFTSLLQEPLSSEHQDLNLHQPSLSYPQLHILHPDTKVRDLEDATTMNEPARVQGRHQPASCNMKTSRNMFSMQDQPKDATTSTVGQPSSRAPEALPSAQAVGPLPNPMSLDSTNIKDVEPEYRGTLDGDENPEGKDMFSKGSAIAGVKRSRRELSASAEVAKKPRWSLRSSNQAGTADDFNTQEMLAAMSPLGLTTIKKALLRPGQINATPQTATKETTSSNLRPLCPALKPASAMISMPSASIRSQASLKAAMKVSKTTGDVEAQVDRHKFGIAKNEATPTHDENASKFSPPGPGENANEQEGTEHPGNNARRPLARKTGRPMARKTITRKLLDPNTSSSSKPSSSHPTPFPAADLLKARQTHNAKRETARNQTADSHAMPDPGPTPVAATTSTNVSLSTTALPQSHQADPNSPTLLQMNLACDPDFEAKRVMSEWSDAQRHLRSEHIEMPAKTGGRKGILKTIRPGQNGDSKSADAAAGEEVDKVDKAQGAQEDFDLAGAIDDLGSYLNTWDAEKQASGLSF